MKFVSLLALSFFITTAAAISQLAPAGSIYVQQPSGVHYLFGTAGTATGGGFFYVNYLTGQFDVITSTTSSTGHISGNSAITGRSLSGQVSANSITLTYNGSTVTGTKVSPYGPTANLAGGYCGFISEPSLGIFFAQLAIQSNGVALLFTAGAPGVSIGIGSIDAGGHLSVKTLNGETVTTTVTLRNGTAQGIATSSFGYNYTYSATRTIPPRLANISTRGFVGSGEKVLIGGFIVKDGGKIVLIDAKGPSLSAQGVAAPLANPRIDLYLGGTVIASNDDWQTNANASEIAASGIAPSNAKEPALQVALEPGAYTVVVSSADGSQGIALVEAYGIE